MTSRKQLILAAALVLAAIAATAVLTGSSGAPKRAVAGHNHSAMGAKGGDRPVKLPESMERRIGVTYAAATEERLARDVDAVGTVTYDERRLVSLNPKIDGWVEELLVDYTGARVRRGQPMLRIYSPSMVAAQEELLLARRLRDRTRAAPDSRAAANAEALLEAARRRLAYWDVPEDEIRRIEESGETRKGLLLRAPATGVVVEKHAQEGARIVPGAALYHIADLSTVWVEAEVFERDISLVHRGQEALVSLDAYPGETFRGRVTYVYPTVSVEARTGRIRVELPNQDGRLKPGMYASVHLSTAPTGRSVTVPRTAVLNTGERSLVFVRASDGTLVPREVRTGLASGDRVAVLEGVAPGDTVVASAAFLIDAESSLGAAMKAMQMKGASQGNTGHTLDDAGAPPPAAGHAGHGAG